MWRITMMRKLKRKLKRLQLELIKPLVFLLKPIVMEIINKEIRVWGDSNRLSISKKASMVNTLFNTTSGCIEIGAYTFAGHNVSIITGTHRYDYLLEKRMTDFEKTGGDIKIGRGVWIGSNATILGPCEIGDHSVIAAGSLVPPHSRIPSNVIIAGIPARVIKVIEVSQQNKDRLLSS